MASVLCAYALFALSIGAAACGSPGSAAVAGPAPLATQNLTAAPDPAPEPGAPPPSHAARVTEPERDALAQELFVLAHQDWMPDDAELPERGRTMATFEGSLAERPDATIALEAGCVFIAGQVLDAMGTPIVAPARLTLDATPVPTDLQLQMGLSFGYGHPVCPESAGEVTVHFGDAPLGSFWLQVHAHPQGG